MVALDFQERRKKAEEAHQFRSLPTHLGLTQSSTNKSLCGRLGWKRRIYSERVWSTRGGAIRHSGGTDTELNEDTQTYAYTTEDNKNSPRNTEAKKLGERERKREKGDSS